MRTFAFRLLSFVLPFISKFNANGPATRHLQTIQPTQSAVLVTGASTGIGADCALQLASVGYLVFCGVRRTEDGERLVQLFRSYPARFSKYPGRIVPVMLNVRDKNHVEKAVKTVESVCKEQNASFIAVVNNAGVATVIPVEIESTESIETMIDVNLTGAIRVTKAFLPLLRKSTVESELNAGVRTVGGSGRVVFIGSLNGTVAPPCMGIYSATKFGLEGLSDALRGELADFGVAVSLVKPGLIYTPIIEKLTSVGRQNADSKLQNASNYYSKLTAVVATEISGMSARAIPASYVSMAIRDAIESPFPATRYHVGVDSVVGSLFRNIVSAFGSVGDKFFDALVVSIIKLDSNLRTGSGLKAGKAA